MCSDSARPKEKGDLWEKVAWWGIKLFGLLDWS